MHTLSTRTHHKHVQQRASATRSAEYFTLGKHTAARTMGQKHNIEYAHTHTHNRNCPSSSTSNSSSSSGRTQSGATIISNLHVYVCTSYTQSHKRTSKPSSVPRQRRATQTQPPPQQHECCLCVPLRAYRIFIIDFNVNT